MADLWTFPQGMLHDSGSVKGYRVDGTDGHLGTVAWADYKPGDAYLVVTVGHPPKHHLVPAGAIAAVDGVGRTVTLRVPSDAVRATPVHKEPLTAYAEATISYIDQFDRGRAGGVAWPYTDF